MTNNRNSNKALSEIFADSAEKAGQSTVLVNGRRRMPSSGIAYKEDLILTADHTVERDENISVYLPDDTEVSADVAGRDPSHDLALLRLSETGAVAAGMVKDEVRVGELVLALGRPSHQGIEASLGVVSAINGPIRTRRGGMMKKFIRTDAVPLPGFSGGPLINSDGLVIGINTSGFAHGTLLTLPASIAWHLAENLAEHGSIKRGYLGIRSQTVEIPETGKDSLNRDQGSGLLVVHVESESPSDASGLMVGDIIVGIAGTPVSHHDELASQLIGEIVGKSVPVEVLRGGSLESIDVVISERVHRRRDKRRMRGKHSRSQKRR